MIRVSSAVFKVAHAFPSVARLALRASWRVLPEHWVVQELFSQLQLQLPTLATLGNGMPIWVMAGDMIGSHIRRNGFYEPDMVTAIKHLLQPDCIFYDIGANVGQYTLAAARVCREVHSFEPSPAVHALLTRTVAMNGIANATINRAALSDSVGEAKFYPAPAANMGIGSLAPTRSEWKQPDEIVSTLTLDTYCETHPAPDVMKVDIEGAEVLMLRGARKTIEKHKPTILIEIDDRNLQRFGFTSRDLAAELALHEYCLKTLDGKEWKHSGGDVMDLNIVAAPGCSRVVASEASRTSSEWRG